jgi:hypothetical protein
MSMPSHFKKLSASQGIGSFILMAVLFFTTMPAFAQEQPPSADDIVAKMQSKLNLTQDQVTAVTPIIEKYASKREALRQSAQDGTDRDSLRSQMKQLKEDESQELAQVLSSGQISQWEQMQKHGRHKHNGDGEGSGGEN